MTNEISQVDFAPYTVEQLKELDVHPDADIFPMLTPEETAELAADIKANGLRHPIVIGEVGGATMLIDGRNRLAACDMAGVMPLVQVMKDGEDPKVLILSENIRRRHMSKGQQAMSVAMMFPEPKKTGRGKKSLIIKDFNGAYISQARTVLRDAPNKAHAVLSGAVALAAAYKDVKDAMKDREPTEEDRMAALTREDEGLAARVKDDADKLTLVEAEAILSANMQAEIDGNTMQVTSIAGALKAGLRGITSFAGDDPALERLVELVSDHEYCRAEMDRYFPDGFSGPEFKEVLEARDRLEKGYRAVSRFLDRIAEGQSND